MDAFGHFRHMCAVIDVLIFVPKLKNIAKIWAFQEKWSCASVAGMLLCHSGNSRPDVAFAVNQAARLTCDPKDSHVAECFQVTKGRGLVLKPSKDCADFCGLWGSEGTNDPIASKSRTGCIIALAGCSPTQRSTLQQETFLSATMADNVALSTAMRELLPLKRLAETIAGVVTGNDEVKVAAKCDAFEGNNGALAVAMDAQGHFLQQVLCCQTPLFQRAHLQCILQSPK